MLSLFSTTARPTTACPTAAPSGAARPVRVALGLTAALTVGAAGPALAHDELLSASPEDGAALIQAPDEVRLDFSGEPIDGQGVQNVIRVTDAFGNQWQDGTAVVEGTELAVPLCQDLAQGEYTTAYRVVYSDGHTAEHSLQFSVADPDAPESDAAPVDCGIPAAGPAGVPSAVGGSVPEAPVSVDATEPGISVPASPTAAQPAPASETAGHPAPASTPAGAADQGTDTAGQADQQDAGVPVWVWVAGVAGLALLVAGVALMGRKARALGHR